MLPASPPQVSPTFRTKEELLMESRRFDALTVSLSNSAPRRRVLLGLGSLALGSVGVVGTTRLTLANNNENNQENKLRRCERRCDRKCDGRPNQNDCQRNCDDQCERRFGK